MTTSVGVAPSWPQQLPDATIAPDLTSSMSALLAQISAAASKPGGSREIGSARPGSLADSGQNPCGSSNVGESSDLAGWICQEPHPPHPKVGRPANGPGVVGRGGGPHEGYHDHRRGREGPQAGGSRAPPAAAPSSRPPTTRPSPRRNWREQPARRKPR